ncbi:MAG: PilZ domain-containing protein [Candidatus Hydrogenedentes bacterium]|nr:PilZ domain-containing protein [Candidatus Hydrogenedentota bacterium]
MRGAITMERVEATELESCLEIGLEVFLDPNPGTPNSRRFPGRVRGWEAGRYLILGLLPSGPPPVLRSGKECIIRFVHEGEVWGVSVSFVEELQGGASRLVQMSWPREVARVQVRRHERVAVQAPCDLYDSGGGSMPGTISDISGGGCSVLARRELEVGSRVLLSFQMPDGVRIDKRPVIVRNRRPVTGGLIKYGCQFQEQDGQDRNIEFFVNRSIASARGGVVATPHLVLLSPREADADEARRALASAHCEIVAAAGVLDLGYLLRTCQPAGVIMSLDQAGLTAVEILPLIRQSPGMAALPIFVYGGGAGLDDAMAHGATHCVNDLSLAAEILRYLDLPESRPGGAQESPGSEVASPAGAPEESGAPMAEAPAPEPVEEEDSGEIRFEE